MGFRDNYSICDPYLALVTHWFRDDGVDFPFSKDKNHNIKFCERANGKLWSYTNNYLIICSIAFPTV